MKDEAKTTSCEVRVDELLIVSISSNIRGKNIVRVSPFLAWGDFHARSRLVRSTIPDEKWGTTRSLN